MFGSWLEDFFSVPTNETCDFESDLSASALGSTDDLEVDSVSCEPLFELKRRAVGRVVVRLVLRRRLNATCGKACLEKESKENEKRIISRLTSPDFRMEIRSGSNITEANLTSVSTELVTHVDTKRVCSAGHRLIKGVCSKSLHVYVRMYIRVCTLHVHVRMHIRVCTLHVHVQI